MPTYTLIITQKHLMQWLPILPAAARAQAEEAIRNNTSLTLTIGDSVEFSEISRRPK